MTGGRRAGEGEKKGSSVPLTRVGRSRIESVNLSTALGIDALGIDALGGGGGGGGSEALERQGTGGESRGGNHGAYRGPGAAAGSEWAPGGRPPRAFVPFLNLPAFDAKGGSGNGRRRRKHGEHNADGIDGVNSPPVPSYVGVGGPPSRIQRGRPLVGVGGVPVSPGRAMLTGPGRPGTGTSEVSSRVFEDTEREDGRGRRRRRRHGGDGGGDGDGGGGGGGGFRPPRNDGELSDGGDSIASGSTDVEFLRRRAEAKLRSLQRQEEVSADGAPGIVGYLF